MLKKLGKTVLCFKLERQVKRLRANNDFMIVAVGGSVGKTSTKLAIAKTLGASKRVIYQDGNYNDRLTVPLVLFGETQPGIFNISAWISLLRRTAKTSKQKFPYDVAVLELGTDAPGQMEQFAYLKPDLYVLSSIAPEHMEYFGSLDAVAEEELQPLKYSVHALINVDDTAAEYLAGKAFASYGFSEGAQYRVADTTQRDFLGQHVSIDLASGQMIDAEVSSLGRQGAKLVLAAAAAAHQIGVAPKDIVKGLQQITPVSGRMQILSGIKNSVLIDDTYNASPLAVKAALDVLYNANAQQKVAILGSMNEMGEGSAHMHEEIGDYCDPTRLDTVVTIGDQAALYLAHAAAQKGCKVVSFLNPYEAGDWVKDNLKEKAVVLAKGSQNGVFAEEALKTLLARKSDEKKLVRQSEYWMNIKGQQFPDSLNV